MLLYVKNINLSKQSIHNIVGRGDHIRMFIDDISEPLLAMYGKYFNRRDYTACILCDINKDIVYTAAERCYRCVRDETSYLKV